MAPRSPHTLLCLLLATLALGAGAGCQRFDWKLGLGGKEVSAADATISTATADEPGVNASAPAAPAEAAPAEAAPAAPAETAAPAEPAAPAASAAAASAAPTAPPQPPDFIEINARGRADQAPGQVDWDTALAQDFTTQSRMLHDTTVTTPGLRVLMARAAGRQMALRRLTDALLATTATSQTTLAAAIAADPAQPARLREWLATHATAEWQDETTSTLATLHVRGEGLAVHLGLVPAPGQLSPEEKETLGRAALDAAMEQARELLRTRLLETPLTDGGTAADYFKAHASAARDLDGLIFIVQPDEIRHPDPRTAEVTIFFDRNLVRELVKNSEHRGFWARLFGR